MTSIPVLVAMEDRFKALMGAASLFMQCESGERQDIISGWPFNVTWLYPDAKFLPWPDDSGYAPEERIKAMLVGLCLEKWGPDERDNLVNMAWTYQAAVLAGLDPEELFSQIIRLAFPRRGGLIKAFIDRSPWEKSAEAFMLEVSVDGSGRKYMRLKPWGASNSRIADRKYFVAPVDNG